MTSLLQKKVGRRQWLRTVGAAAMLGSLGRMNALSQNAPPSYKALVCVFLAGGNDGHNTIIPLTQSLFNSYKAGRGSLALPDNNGPLLQVQSDNGDPYGLNPGLAAIHPLWASQKLAVLANTGMLIEPVTRAGYLGKSVAVPTNLFSHSDQIQQMQTSYGSTSGGTGWGGRTADKVQASNNGSTFPSAVSIAGPSLFCVGDVVQSASLMPGFNLDMAGMNLWPQAATAARKNGIQQILQMNSGMTLVQAANQVRKDALDLNSLLSGSSATLGTTFPGTSIGMQLQQVAKIIKLRNTTGMSRQVFFCSLGGFDTHGAQGWQHWDLLRQLSEALIAFYNSTVEMGVADSVTSFTLSDFGRSLQPSGSGTDHGWGNHHIVLGGAVSGGKVYGQFPDLSLGGPSDSGSRGTLIPTTALDQYGATLASWFGVPSDQLDAVFPNLKNFQTKTLGFLA
ncbi:MAG TPA: DUF1501 domain-containing protein [Methylomirabilota bacterium]|nr:DUF1501 domain-containing protein [Methylomirabilota bacterium]